MMLQTKKILGRILLLCAFFSFSEATIMADEHVIIGFHNQPGDTEKKLITDLGGTIGHTYSLLPAISAEIPKEELDALLRHPLVSYIEQDKSVVSIDPISFGSISSLSFLQSSATNTEYQNSWGVEHIGAKAVHDKNITGYGVKIAILDTGINYKHEDLDANYRGGYNFIINGNGTDDPFDDSWNAHGTHIAGIIAAEANGIGGVGVAPDASIYAVKVLDGGGFGSVSDIIAGIEWSVDNEMDIANISIAGIDSDILQIACDAAEKAGLLIVAAAGNTYGEAAAYPASFESVIAVAGTDDADMRGFFSPVDSVLEIAAPGLYIRSTSFENTYAELSGTSQSAAFVSAAAALIISSGISDINGDGEVNNQDVRKKLQMSVIDLGEIGRDNEFGYGLIDISQVATAPFELFINLTKKEGWDESVQKISLENSIYEVMMQNDSLLIVGVVVLEKNNFRSDLTNFYYFKDTNDLSFTLDATDTTFEVYLIPIGQVGASAHITVTK